MEEIRNLEIEIRKLEDELIQKKLRLCCLKEKVNSFNLSENLLDYTSDLLPSEISRYSRQLILPNFGLNNQLRLKNSTVLIVGVGGLGCPASLYLAAAGVGHLVLIDNDNIETTNLARQILFNELSNGEKKSKIATKFLTTLNPNIQVTALTCMLEKKNISEILSSYNFNAVIDATDNILTRYLLNDYCAHYRIPLIFGSALQWEGQLTVYNYDEGPCYRCVLPVPPSPEFVTDCADGGVVGPVVGCIGVLQALETIKILMKSNNVLSGRMLLFDGEYGTFKVINLRTKVNTCLGCGSNSLDLNNVDYIQFCKLKSDTYCLPNDKRIPFKEFYRNYLRNEYKFLIDVRLKLEYDLYKFKNSIHLSMNDLENDHVLEEIAEKINKLQSKNIIVICRRGNDSRIVVKKLMSKFPNVFFRDVIGGFNALHTFQPNIPLF